MRHEYWLVDSLIIDLVTNRRTLHLENFSKYSDKSKYVFFHQTIEILSLSENRP